MLQNFDEHAQRGNEFLQLIALELGDTSNKEAAERITRAVFRSLRELLTLEENFQLIAQLPIILKGLYVEGWAPQKKNKKRSKKLDDFYLDVIKEEGAKARKDFTTEDEIKKGVNAVFTVLRMYISEGQMKDAKAVVPDEIKILFSANSIETH